MNIDVLKTKIPDYAKDIKLNLSSLLAGTEPIALDGLQIVALALAAAYATRHKTVIQLLEGLAKQEALTHEAINAVKAAVSIMAMNNVYYRSVHWIHGDTYVKLPANLRMQILQKHGVSQKDFELYCVVVSAMNGCERCLDSHVSALEKGGLGTVEIQYTLRIASVMQAFAQVLTIEEASS
jgi:alkyl hydroperoxide reductase subunit D